MLLKTLAAKGMTAIFAVLLLATSVLIGHAAAVPGAAANATTSSTFVHDRNDDDDDDDDRWDRDRRDGRDRRDRINRRRRDRDDDDYRFSCSRRFSKKHRNDWFRDWRDLNRGRGRGRDRDYDRDRDHDRDRDRDNDRDRDGRRR